MPRCLCVHKERQRKLRNDQLQHILPGNKSFLHDQELMVGNVVSKPSGRSRGFDSEP